MARKRRWTGTLFRFLLYAIAVSLAVTFTSTLLAAPPTR